MKKLTSIKLTFYLYKKIELGSNSKMPYNN